MSRPGAALEDDRGFSFSLFDLRSPGRGGSLIKGGDDEGAMFNDDEFSSSFVSEFLEYQRSINAKQTKKDLQNFVVLPGGQTHPNFTKRRQSLTASPQPNSTRRLTRSEGKAKRDPYSRVNEKISRVLKRGKIKGRKDDARASGLELVCQIVQRESNSAIKLQAECRRVLATRYVNDLAHRTRNAVVVQCAVRCYNARRRLLQLRSEKERCRLVRERLVRRFVAKCRRRKRIELEHRSAITIQCSVRSHFARSAANVKRRQLSWSVNQERFQQLSIRLSWADRRTFCFARKIQSQMRRVLAQERVRALAVLHAVAATKIQSAYRRFAARLQTDEMEFKRIQSSAEDKVRLVLAESRHWERRVEDLGTPARIRAKEGLEERRAQLESELDLKHQQIFALETYMKNQLKLKDDITPRGISGGWEENVESNLKDTRERITNAKLDLLFNIQKEFKLVSSELQSIYEQEQDANETLQYFRDWHEAEQGALWELQREHNRKVEARDLKHRIVDETLKWKVVFTTRSGKPDRRKPVRHGRAQFASADRLDDLIERAGAKNDASRESMHLAALFKPFEKMWEKCNAMTSLPGSMGVTNDRGRNARQPNGLASSLLQAQQQPRSNAKVGFPMHVPFHLLDEVRGERMAIEATKASARS